MSSAQDLLGALCLTEPLLGWADDLTGWKGHRPSADRVSVGERKVESPECWGWAHKSCGSNWTATGKVGRGEKWGAVLLP